MRAVEGRDAAEQAIAELLLCAGRYRRAAYAIDAWEASRRAHTRQIEETR